MSRKNHEDSLTGMFEVIYPPYWSFEECREAFGYSLDDFLYFGGLPKAAKLRDDPIRWKSYVRESVIEPAIYRDVLERTDVRKPALLRALFDLGIRFSGTETLYNKMLGYLSDAGKTTTLAHYLDLLNETRLLCAVEKYDPERTSSRRTSPKLLVYDTSLITAALPSDKSLLLSYSERKGQLIECFIGVYLIGLSWEK